MKISAINTLATIPKVKHGSFTLILFLKMGILFGALILVKFLTNPKRAPKQEVVIDYERLW